MVNQRWKPVVGWAARFGPIPVAAVLLFAVWQDWMSWRDFGFIISAVVAISVLYRVGPGKAEENHVDDAPSNGEHR